MIEACLFNTYVDIVFNKLDTVARTTNKKNARFCYDIADEAPINSRIMSAINPLLKISCLSQSSDGSVKNIAKQASIWHKMIVYVIFSHKK